MGCEPMKVMGGGRVARAAAQGAALVLPTSVTRASGGRLGTVAASTSAVLSTGTQMTTSAASRTQPAGVSWMLSHQG